MYLPLSGMGSGSKMIGFEFNSFLLKVAEELTSSDVRKLKFVLKEFIPPAQSERTTEAFHYFEELQRRCLLSPTDFHMLKKAFEAIGRIDLVEELEAKEHHFGEQSQRKPIPGIYKGDDVVHDGKLLGRSGTNPPQLHGTMEGEDDLELPDGPSGEMAKPEPEKECQHKKVNIRKDEIGIKEEDVAVYKTTPLMYSEPDNGLNNIEEPVNSKMLIEPSCQTKMTGHNEPIPRKDYCNALEQLSVSSSDAAYGKKNEVNAKEPHKAALICNSAVGKTEKKTLQEVSSGKHLAKGAKSKVPWPSLPAPDQMATEQEDKGGAKTLQHGMVMPSTEEVTGHAAVNDGASKFSKEPTEDDYSGEATVCGAFQAEASSSGGQQGPSFPAPLYKGIGGSFLTHKALLQEASLAPSTFNAAGWAAKPTSYIKGNYSVRINPGTHFQSTEDMGVVIMESGRSYQIEITNQNDYAAEVDISNGGKFLGVWLVEARQSNPLIIQGSAWEEGRLTFFSATDRRRPPTQSGFEEATGKVELHFKPEAWRMFAQHVRMEQKYEILVTNFYTATVRDLKRNIETKYGSEVGIVACLIKNGNVLDEEKTIRAYNLKPGDIIQMLNNQEKLAVRVPDGTTITLQVDPRNISTHRLMAAIEDKLNLPPSRRKRRLRFNGQDIEDMRSPVEIFLLSKEPVLQLEVEYPIKIRVRLPEGTEMKVSLNLFASVQEFRNKLVSQGICDRNAVLEFDGTEIKSVDGDESKPLLIDLGLENDSTVTVQRSQKKRAILRGFDSSSFAKHDEKDLLVWTQIFVSNENASMVQVDRGQRGREFYVIDGGDVLSLYLCRAEGFQGFGELEDLACGPPFLRQCGNVLARQYISPGSRLVRGSNGGFERLESDEGFISEFNEGRAVLIGRERFDSQFTVDSDDRRFSEEGSVTLVIQLVSRDSTSIGSRPSVQHPLQPRPTRTGPMSTPLPPPVPE